MLREANARRSMQALLRIRGTDFFSANLLAPSTAPNHRSIWLSCDTLVRHERPHRRFHSTAAGRASGRSRSWSVGPVRNP
jgi:hypothetical protein